LHGAPSERGLAAGRRRATSSDVSPNGGVRRSSEILQARRFPLCNLAQAIGTTARLAKIDRIGHFIPLLQRLQLIGGMRDRK
jgi:hypothetical protein